MTGDEPLLFVITSWVDPHADPMQYISVERDLRIQFRFIFG